MTARLSTRSAAAAGFIVAAGLFLARPAGAAHPHFDDRGALPWTTRLDDARAAARQSGKLIFIEYGRAK